MTAVQNQGINQIFDMDTFYFNTQNTVDRDSVTNFEKWLKIY